MSATIQVKRRINGASGSPTGTSKAGEVALKLSWRSWRNNDARALGE